MSEKQIRLLKNGAGKKHQASIGLSGWLPQGTVSSTAFFGVDRSEKMKTTIWHDLVADELILITKNPVYFSSFSVIERGSRYSWEFGISVVTYEPSFFKEAVEAGLIVEIGEFE